MPSTLSLGALRRRLHLAWLLQTVAILEYLVGLALLGQASLASQIIFAILIVQAAAISAYVFLILRRIAAGGSNEFKFGQVGRLTLFLPSLLSPLLVVVLASFVFLLPLESLIFNLGPFFIPGVASGVLLIMLPSFASRRVSSFGMSSSADHWKP